MYIIYGEGKVGTGIKNLLNFLGKESYIIDDKLGNYDQEILKNAELVIPSPGIKPTHKIYQEFGHKIKSELNFIGDLITELGISDNLVFIGITGTNGKSTTTHIAYNIFNNLELDGHIRLSGNFGIPLSQTLTDILSEKKQNQKNYIIMECSSFMLYKLGNFYFDYSILLNIARDHLDRHADMDDYSQSKINIIKNTKYKAFTPANILKKLESTDAINHVSIKIDIYTEDYDLQGTQFLGQHNKGNIKACLMLTKAFLDDNKIYKSDEELRNIINLISPLPHRLQLVKQVNGTRIYDDGICTSTHAQAEALKSFEEKVILICGGHDKGNDYEAMKDIYKEKVAYGVFIGTSATSFENVFKQQNIECVIKNTLHDAIQESYHYSQYNNNLSILFSPGCASFDMFKNVYDRIEQFEKEIENLQ